MVKKSIQANFQINVTKTAQQTSVGSRSARRTRFKRPALGPVRQALCQQAFGIF